MKTAPNNARMADAWARALNCAPLCYRLPPAPSQVRLRDQHDWQHAELTRKKIDCATNEILAFLNCNQHEVGRRR